jgi:aspartyl-tRNA(Asn)/glutamyl-tRNA(Gln) amidotransferase subunit A
MTVPSLETPGVLARGVGECRAAYEAMAAHPWARGADAGPLRVAALEDLFEGCDADVAVAARGALTALAATHRVETARLDYRPRGLGRLFAAELEATWGDAIRAEPDRFFAEVRAGAEAGRAVPGDERRAILAAFVADRRRVGRRLARFDVVASPTVPIAVPLAGEERVDVCTRLTRPFNALGWPAISVPCGTDRNGCPVGLQLASRPSRVAALFAVALAAEAAR